MNRLAVWIGSVVVVLAVLGLGGALGWSKYAEITAAMSAPPPPEQPIAVVVADSTQAEYRYSTTVIGTVLAPQSIMLSNEIAGTVVELGFQSGAEVVAGQKLVELDASVERAQLAAVSAKRKMAESTLARLSQAAANRAVSPVEVDEAQSMLTQTVAEVQQLEAVIAKKTLVAPFPARIGLSNTHVGQFLPSGSEIVSLQSNEGYVHIDFMVPQSAADFIRIGHEVTLFDEGASYTAAVSAIDSQADRSTRNLLVRAVLEPVPPTLLPGDSVRVLVEYGPPQNTAAVPVEAIRRAPMKTFVYVVETDQDGNLRARERPVKVGQMIGERFSVLSGLEAGVAVVADGSFKLRDGVLITPVSLPSSSPAPAPAFDSAPASSAMPPQETAGK